MAINITAVGSAGVHSFKKVNVNSEANYVYFKDSDIPAGLVDGAAYTYNDGGTGSIDGIENNSLVYPFRETDQILKLLDSEEGELDLTGSSNGEVYF